MPVATKSVISVIADFVVDSRPPDSARQRAAVAVCDTVGVILAGAVEPAAQIARAIIGGEGDLSRAGHVAPCGRSGRGVRQRRRRSRARLRRHVLRVDGASELRPGTGGARVG